jgi:hypothetical protein
VNINGIQRRTERVEAKAEANGDQPKEYLIDVQYYDVIDGKDVAIRGTYDPVDWDKIKPDARGNRTAVRYPKEDA